MRVPLALAIERLEGAAQAEEDEDRAEGRNRDMGAMGEALDEDDG